MSTKDTKTAAKVGARSSRNSSRTAAAGTSASSPAAAARLTVKKTYKLYVGGAFPRSESGRSYMVNDAKGQPVANAAKASRKDARDAVVAARSAFKSWSGRTAYNRSQILYRIAEVMDSRRSQFIESVVSGEGVTAARATDLVDQAIDRLVWYAGWPDKISQVLGATNPVQGPYFNVSTPQPMGVVAVFAPQDSSLLGLISVIAPVIASGNTVVVVASTDRPLAAVDLAEVLATSDVPGGVVNILTGDVAELATPLASHMDVNALDVTGVAAGEARVALEVAAVENLKRVYLPRADEDFAEVPGLERLAFFLELRTVWHPVGV